MFKLKKIMTLKINGITKVKDFLLFLMLNFLFFNTSYADVVEGFMHCTIKSQKITELIDGKVTIYNKYKGDYLEVGDTIQFKYNFNKKNREILFNLSAKNYQVYVYSSGKLIKDKTEIDEFGYINLSIVWGVDDFRDIKFSKERIVFNDGDIFDRYFKDDWMGITTKTTGFANSIVSETNIRT